MMRSTTIPAAMALVLLALTAAAQEAGQPIASLLNSRTLAVAQADLQKLDLDAIEKSLLEVLPVVQPDVAGREKARAEIVEGIKQARAWHARVRQAGARTVYGVLTLTDLMSGEPGFLFVSVDEGKAQAVSDALGVLLPRGQDAAGAPVVEAFAGGVVIAERSVIQNLKEAKPEARPELIEALAAADAPVRVAIAPSTDIKRALAALSKPLPNRWGGGSPEALVRGTRWIAIGLNPSQDAAGLRLVAQAQDATSAQALEHVLSMLSDELSASSDTPAARQALARLKVMPDASHRLIIALERQPTLSLLGESLKQQRAKATLAVSQNHVRQLLVGALMYANDHQGNWPDNLQSLVEARYVAQAEALKNPRSGDGQGSYVYVKPKDSASKLQNPGGVVIVHEPFEGADGKVNAGFADGHVELLPIEEVRKRLGQ